MHILNLELSLLGSPEFLRSRPCERATWLCLMAYCTLRETGGVISDCKDWEDCDWLTVVHVGLADVRSPSSLWQWVDGSLHVWGYPVINEIRFRERREKAAKGAARRWGQDVPNALSPMPAGASEDEVINANAHANAYAKADANAYAQADANAYAQADARAYANAMLKEKKVKESNDLEGAGTHPNADATVVSGERLKLPTSAGEVFEAMRDHGGTQQMAGAFLNYYNSIGWVIGNRPIVNWRAAACQWVARNAQRGRSPGNSSPESPPVLSNLERCMTSNRRFPTAVGES